MYIIIYTYIYPDTAKHQSKPQVYISDICSTLWSDIAPCGQIQNLPLKQTTRKQRLPSPKCRQKGRRSIDIKKSFVIREIY